MKILILALSLLCFNVWAQEVSEPGWKTKLRSYISRVTGPDLAESLLGKAPQGAPEVSMPEIPKDFKKSTDTSAYDNIKKDSTEFDRLPAERRRQFDYKFLEELFMVTRKSEPRDEDLSTWLNTLDQGGSREGIYQALVLDEVYAALENMEERPSEKVQKFIQAFASKYVGTSYKEETLAQSNIYTLKRVLTEKGLDIMEYYETNDLDALYRWYAHFSYDLATQYGAIFKSPVREEPSLTYHYQWAREMPIQHIKSEFIIKLHTVMNNLQVL